MKKILNTDRPTYSSTTTQLAGRTEDQEANLIISHNLAMAAKNTTNFAINDEILDAMEAEAITRGWEIQLQIGGCAGICVRTPDLTYKEYDAAMALFAEKYSMWYVCIGGVNRIVPRLTRQYNSENIYLDGRWVSSQGKNDPFASPSFKRQMYGKRFNLPVGEAGITGDNSVDDDHIIVENDDGSHSTINLITKERIRAEW